MDASQSTIEQVWNAAPAGHTLIPNRVERYDPNSGIFFAPIEYEYKELEYCNDNPPSQQWVQEAFVAFVRGEFGSPSTRGEYPGQAEWATQKTASERDILTYRDRCENELLYSGLIDDLIANSGPRMSDQLYSLFTNPILGNRETSKYLNLNEFSAQVGPLIEQHDRLRFILPSFPFKDQNVFRTEAPPSHVDLGEIATLVRLHVLALAMFQVHPFGADWIVVSDGLAYAPIFQVDINEATAYRNQLLEYRNQLNIQGTVSVIDLKEMTRKLRSRQAGFEIFDQTVAQIQDAIEEMVKPETGQVYESFRVLTRGMKWNMNTRTLGEHLEWEDLWTILSTELIDDVPPRLLTAWQEIDKLGVKAASTYAAFNLALRYHSVFDRVLPNSLRATMHPKAGQIAVPRLGELFAWNGVGVLRDERLGPTSVETWPLYKLIKECPSAIPYLLYGQGAPLYYLFPSGSRSGRSSFN